MTNRDTLNEVIQSLGKVLTLLGGAVHEIQSVNFRQAKAAANLLRICADRIDSLVEEERGND